MAICQETSAMSLTIADDGVGATVFGTCMSLCGTFRDMIGDEALTEHG
jgi:hypothetical protein